MKEYKAILKIAEAYEDLGYKLQCIRKISYSQTNIISIIFNNGYNMYKVEIGSKEFAFLKPGNWYSFNGFKDCFKEWQEKNGKKKE